MIKCIEFPDRDFNSKHEMLKAIYANKDKIISIKKASIHTHKTVPLRFYSDIKKKAFTAKGIADIGGLDKGFLYPVISNTNLVDSHKDAHLDNSMNRTVKNQQGKVHYAMNHELAIGKIIAYPEDVEMLLKEIRWKELGYSYKGKTQALLFKTNLQDYSPEDARKAIVNKLPVENSIRMIYVQIELGIKERNKEWEDANEAYDKHINKIVNRDDIEDDYIWFIKELKIVDEGSMVVKGSNPATPIQYDNDESAKSTSSQQDSPQDTPKTEDNNEVSSLENFYSHLNIK